LVVAFILGCGGRTPPVSRSERDADAQTFGARLIDVLERDDVAGFHDLLSMRVRVRGDVDRRFASWRRELVPFAQALRDAEWTFADNTIRFRAIGRAPEELAHVVEERGALRLDEI
jgi:hypothetical protein